MKKRLLFIVSCILINFTVFSQNTVSGTIKDDVTSEPLIGATILVLSTGEGSITDYNGDFELKTSLEFPFEVEIAYTGYDKKRLTISNDDKLKIRLEEGAVTIETVEIKGQRISEKQKAAPLTIESLDILAIKETPSDNFYDGLGALKGVDLTAASLGFKIINTRGFNSTSPVRSLQIIDGVDNQSPGLNFSLGNFLGSSELDVQKVDLIVGASSAYYGPNAFNGVISMTTKNPFVHKGLSASIKAGERNLLEAALRWGNSVDNKNGKPWFAYKFNLFYLQADDWEATNNNAVDGTDTQTGNPGRWDAVNTYGDEYFSLGDYSDESANLTSSRAGLDIFHRVGYQEKDLVDYNTRNQKANASFHFRLKPEMEFDSPELILSSSLGSGTTVYQGDNRFSLRDILFYQNRIEVRKKDDWFLRAYATNEDAGNSYDPYFTALRMQEAAKDNTDWYKEYTSFWQSEIYTKRMRPLGYPVPTISSTGMLEFDFNEANSWLMEHQDSLTFWHQLAGDFANQANPLLTESYDFYEPGTQRFQEAFDSITSLKNNEGGTRFFDKSALYHLHGEYTFKTEAIDNIKVGANVRMYRPNSEGTVFSDSAGIKITNSEFGVYAGLEKKFTRKWTLNGTLRMDKNENFDYLFTPAASVVYSPNVQNYLRLSFSAGVRNPTLSDQYLNLNVGPATLAGNLTGWDSLLTVESFIDYLSNNFDNTQLDYRNIAPVQPEKVKTVEVGYRTTIMEKLFLDASYYYSFYNQFIGYNIGIRAEFSPFGIPSSTDVYRVAANSTNEVTTQGFAIGANYFFGDYYQVSGNYSWNKLNKTFEDDPIIPAFNTPEHKFNIGISGRNMPINLGFMKFRHSGFNINYKWIQGFEFEGSPQFTGNIPDYGLLDAQFNVKFDRINTTLKIGASNLLDNKTFQTYGGPRIGRLAYASLLYSFDKK